MNKGPQDRADAALAQALEERGVRDPRDACRALLRKLKARDRSAYERAVAHYEETLVPSVASGEADPLEAWLAYAGHLAGLIAPGRTVEIDEAGLARDCTARLPPGRLVLHLADGGEPPALVVALPATLTPAQQATYDLLVAARVELRAGSAGS